MYGFYDILLRLKRKSSKVKLVGDRNIGVLRLELEVEGVGRGR